MCFPPLVSFQELHMQRLKQKGREKESALCPLVVHATTLRCELPASLGIEISSFWNVNLVELPILLTLTYYSFLQLSPRTCLACRGCRITVKKNWENNELSTLYANRATNLFTHTLSFFFCETGKQCNAVTIRIRLSSPGYGLAGNGTG